MPGAEKWKLIGHIDALVSGHKANKKLSVDPWMPGTHSLTQPAQDGSGVSPDIKARFPKSTDGGPDYPSALPVLSGASGLLSTIWIATRI